MQQDNNTIASAGRSYDTFGRIASISNGTDTLSYTYRPGGQLSLAGWTNGQDSAMSNQSYEYDQYNRLTGIKLNNINEVSYTLNAKDQRTAATYANAGLWNFTYDDKGQVTGANGSSKSYAYSYDGIGNRLTANENSTVTNYTSNLLNQYTLINSAVPNYDADGNMTTSGNGWAYTYNGENRITQATKGSTSVTMAYDYAGRRISKTISVSGVVQNSYKYAYDGFKLIAVYDNNDLVMTFAWQPESLGMDMPVSMTYGGATYYYVTDGNKNVTALLDASGNRVAEYVYGPFGQTVSATGVMAPINPFRFSSEFHDDETGLVYYNYRYYSPELGRWTKRDPIEEEGGSNLYGFIENNVISNIDFHGLLLFAFDGTANYENELTNVSLMHRAYIAPDRDKFYYRGIGNKIDYSYRPVSRKIIQAFGVTLNGKVSDAISDLKKYLQTYNKKKTPVCNIDIVGFSRGAIAAVRFAEKVKSISTEYNIKHIRFAGLFDPVEGGMRDATTTKMNSFVRYAAIAYSITESRDVFQPTYYYPEVPENVFRYDPAIRSDRYVRPLFFWGGHSDVGGGYKDRGLSNITLGWMIQEGIRAGAPFSTAGLNAHIVKNGFTHIVHRKQEDKFFYTHSHRVFPYWARSHSSVFKYSNGFLPKLP